jgi:hypothetical protein
VPTANSDFPIEMGATNCAKPARQTAIAQDLRSGNAGQMTIDE